MKKQYISIDEAFQLAREAQPQGKISFRWAGDDEPLVDEDGAWWIAAEKVRSYVLMNGDSDKRQPVLDAIG